MKVLMAVFRMEHAADINAFICRLRKLPFLKKVISEKWYGNAQMKRVFSWVTIVWKILSLFALKFLYVGLLIYLAAVLLPGEDSREFLHVFYFMTFTGIFLNVEILDSNKNKYYAVTLMRVDAKKYALFCYLDYLLKTFVGLFPAYLIFGTLAGVPTILCLMLSLITVAGKSLGTVCMLKLYEKTRKILSVDYSGWYLLAGILVGFGAGYGLLALKISISVYVVLGTGLIFLICSPFCFRYIWKSRIYRKLYKERMTFNQVVFHAAETSRDIQREAFSKKMEIGTYQSSKSGYEYFNDIFVHRHKHLLIQSAKRVAVIMAIIFAGLLTGMIFVADMRKVLNSMVLNMLPYMVFIMYLINRGETVAKAMFFNCDHSMLTYRFYRQPDAVLHLFKVRLKTLIKINLLPGSVMAIGLLAVLVCSGGTSDVINYFLLPCSILLMSVFFSLHHLVLYYLLQPYNVQMETKSHGYTIATFLTYVVCYFFIRLKMSTLVFASLVLVFCAIYIAAALKLVYRKAPSTFRLK